ncbi:MAG: MmcQ/YjbR family DNA-binding protein, partial [Chloroflexota bacterium]
DVREIAAALPGIEESTSYGTPAFKVGARLFLRRLADPDLIVVFVGFEERDTLVAERPDSFLVTPHYRDHPMLVIRLPAVDPAELRRLIEGSWTQRAPATLRRRRSP